MDQIALIFSIVNKISIHVDKVKYNNKDCEDLVEHVKDLQPLLKKLQERGEDQEVTNALAKLQKTLEEAEEVVQKYTSDKSRFIAVGGHRDTFQRLNAHLDRAIQMLNLALTMTRTSQTNDKLGEVASQLTNETQYEGACQRAEAAADRKEGQKRTADMKTNLLKNPNGEEQMESWELTENGGCQWRVEDLPGDCGIDFCGDGVTKYFVTSSQLCLKRQVIDLQSDGYSPCSLDAQPPVTVEDWYCGRTDCGCTYEITVCLLDENKRVLQKFQPGTVTLNPARDRSWKQVRHTFRRYGRGLRFISFEHGGKDTKCWHGWYGVRVTGSSVTIEA